jgi:hypothetical protein
MAHAAVVALDTEKGASLLALGFLRRAQQGDCGKKEGEKPQGEFLFHDDTPYGSSALELAGTCK